jgi:hypothetical protein
MARSTAAPFSVRELSRRICLRPANCEDDGSAEALDASPTDRPADLDAAFFEVPVLDILAADEEGVDSSSTASVEGRGEEGLSCGPLLPLEDAVEEEDTEDLRKGFDMERCRRWGWDMTLGADKGGALEGPQTGARGEELLIGEAGEARRSDKGAGRDRGSKKGPRAQHTTSRSTGRAAGRRDTQRSKAASAATLHLLHHMGNAAV